MKTLWLLLFPFLLFSCGREGDPALVPGTLFEPLPVDFIPVIDEDDNEEETDPFFEDNDDKDEDSIIPKEDDDE